MKTSAILASAAISILALSSMSSCGKIITVKSKADDVKRTINVKGQFSAIRTNDITDVKYTDGPLSITLSAPDEIIDLIHVTVQDGTLVVDMDESDRRFNGNFHSELTVSAPGVTSFCTNGTGDFDLDNINGNVIIFESNGTGDFEAHSLNCTTFKLSTNGTGDAVIKHVQAEDMDLYSAGTGDIEITEIKVNKLVASTYGTGDIDFNRGSAQTAKLTNCSTGDINMRNVKIGSVEQYNSGAGDINL
jgi:hypothetical protein